MHKQCLFYAPKTVEKVIFLPIICAIFPLKYILNRFLLNNMHNLLDFSEETVYI